jgi:hypothetical protein
LSRFTNPLPGKAYRSPARTINFRASRRARASASEHRCPEADRRIAAPAGPRARRAFKKTAENCAFGLLARLVLKTLRQGQRHGFSKGRMKMAKLESITFVVGMALSSLLMFATLAPLA